MKLWQKIYLFSLIIMIITISLSGNLLIENFHTNLLHQEIERGISQEKFLAFEFKLNTNDVIMLMKGYQNYSEFEASINGMMSHYASTMQYEGYFQILDARDQLVYSDFDFPRPNKCPEFKGMDSSKIHYIIRQIDGKHYLYICGTVDIYDTLLKQR